MSARLTEATIELVSLLSSLGLSLREIVNLQPNDIRPEPMQMPVARSRALTKEKAMLVLAASDKSNNIKLRCMVRLCLYIGARQCEIGRLTSDAVERSADGVYVTLTGKGGKRRRVWVPEHLGFMLTMLSHGMPPGRRLFPYSGRHVRLLLTRFMRAAGLRGGPHRLRHTAATWMLNSGSTLEEAMEILGHSDVSAHEVYAIANEGWLLEQWVKHHPMSNGTIPGAHIIVRGERLVRYMARGVERAVPVPLRYVDDIMAALPVPGYRHITRAFHRMSDTSPSDIRRQLAITMAERGMHPFAVSLILGVTPAHVVDSRWDRRGPVADSNRRMAIGRAMSNLEAV